MSLRRFYGYTGTVSAKTTARIYLLTGVFLWAFGLVCWILMKLHIIPPDEPHTPLEVLEQNARDQGYDID